MVNPTLCPESIEDIRARRNRTVVAVVYCTFGDESRDESKQRVYAVAGAFGSQEEWDALELVWSARLEGRAFHASDCECGHGEFSKTSHADNQRLYRDLVGIIAKSRIVGQDYRSVFPSDHEHTPYLWGFGDVVQAASELAYLSVPQDEVRIVFDRNEELEFSAAEMYRYCLGMKTIVARGNLFGEISFACRRTVGIQVADLFARETMKHLDNQVGPTTRCERRSFAALRKNHKFRFVCYTRELLEKGIKASPPGSRPGVTLADYRKWLSEKRLDDSLTNRIRHIVEFP